MKILLEYEEVALHLQYNAKKEFFSNSVYPPNPECKDAFCIERQKEKKDQKGFLGERKEKIAQKNKENQRPVVQNQEEVDQWAIELVEDDTVSESTQTTGKLIKSEDIENQNLDDLMSQLKNM